MTPDRYWYALGRFHILALPLYLNPFWTTHHVYLDGKIVGKQLSVPSEAECEQYLAVQRSTITEKPKRGFCLHRKAGPGRPRKDNSYRRWLEALET